MRTAAQGEMDRLFRHVEQRLAAAPNVEELLVSGLVEGAGGFASRPALRALLARSSPIAGQDRPFLSWRRSSGQSRCGPTPPSAVSSRRNVPPSAWPSG